MSTYELHERPEIREPILVLCLEGWIDAGLAGATAAGSLLEQTGSRVIATFDADGLLDHRARRPVVRIVDGVNTGLTWPDLQLRLGFDATGRPILILVGTEPDHSWRKFCNDVVGLAQELGVQMVVGLGAFPAPVPHTRPCRLTSTATSAEWAARVGFMPGSLSVPAGIEAALEMAFDAVDVPAIGLWARVPHYIATMPYPEAAAELLDGLSRLTGLTLDTASLRAAASDTRNRVDELLTGNPEHLQLVRRLEAQLDAEVSGAGDPLSEDLLAGNDLAAEVERFLRGEGQQPG